MAKPKPKPPVLYANAGGVIGPAGERLRPGEEVPADWPEEIRSALVDTGGAAKVRRVPAPTGPEPPIAMPARARRT